MSLLNWLRPPRGDEPEPEPAPIDARNFLFGAPGAGGEELPLSALTAREGAPEPAAASESAAAAVAILDDDRYRHGHATPGFVVRSPWRLRTPDGLIAAQTIGFLPDGCVIGTNRDEQRWCIDEGMLCFADPEGTITTRFDRQSADRACLTLSGFYKGDASHSLALERLGWAGELPDHLRRLRIVASLDAAEAASLGVSLEAAITLFRGPAPADAPCPVVAGTPAHLALHMAEEHNAAAFAFETIAAGGFAPDIFTNMPVRCEATLSRDDARELRAPFVPFFYRFRSPTGALWWLIAHSVTGRPVLAWLPDQSVAFCLRGEYPPDEVPGLLRELQIAIEREVPGPSADLVAVVSLIDNHGHQLINQLSAVQRLLDERALPALSEIWIAGSEFYGPLERIFPEFAGRVRRFATGWQVEAALRGTGIRAFAIGSSYTQAALAGRIVGAARAAAPVLPPMLASRGPLIAFTLRSGGRSCQNLVDMIVHVTFGLLPHHPGLVIVLDGWVIPESHVVLGSTAYSVETNGFHREPVRRDLAVVREIVGRLPPGVVVRNLVGERLLASVSGLQDIDAYVSHVGTLQHKIAFLSGRPGVIHGPTAQLAAVETGHYSTEAGVAPRVLDPACVEDIGLSTGRGARFDDYRIVDPGRIANMLLEILAERAAEG